MIKLSVFLLEEVRMKKEFIKKKIEDLVSIYTFLYFFDVICGLGIIILTVLIF